MVNNILSYFNDPYFLKIFIGTFLLGFAAGAIGIFPTLRKQALIGDALSHAALPGVVIAFMIFNSRDILILLLGALVFSFISIGLIELIKKYSIIKYDASMALILSAFFGFGNVLLSMLKSSNQAGLSKFIFGEAATMLEKDVVMIIISSVILLIISILFWNQIKAFIFDQKFYQSLGFNSNITRFLITFLTVLVVVISIRTIGVILMSALLIAPAISARQWSNKLSVNFILAGIFGAISAGIGTFISFNVNGIPTGPIIVIILSVLLIVSLLFSPKKGILVTFINSKKQKSLIKKYHDLVHFYEFGEIEDNIALSFYSEGLLNIDNNTYFISDRGHTLINNIMRGKNLWE